MINSDAIIFTFMSFLALIVGFGIMRKKNKYNDGEKSDDDWRQSLDLDDMEWGDPDHPERPDTDDDEAWRS